MGSYTGKGTYGESNPNILTFDFVPSVIIMVSETRSNGLNYSYKTSGNSLILSLISKTTDYKPDDFGTGTSDLATNRIKLSEDKKTVYWYSENAASYQFNKSSCIYHYIAFE